MRTPLSLAFMGLATLALVAASSLPGPAGAVLPRPDEGARTAPAMAPVLDPAPDFTLTDTNGRQHRLSAYEGQWVVLEWLNYDCPFVRKHYNSGAMQQLQERFAERGVVWLSIVSSAPGQQGYFSNDEMNARTEAHGGHQAAVLMDPTGAVGRAYGARTTPHMFVINPDREIVYAGAIDNRPSPDPATLQGATNYVVEALNAAMQGRPVQTARTQPYGCSVKYGA